MTAMALMGDPKPKSEFSLDIWLECVERAYYAAGLKVTVHINKDGSLLIRRVK